MKCLKYVLLGCLILSSAAFAAQENRGGNLYGPQSQVCGKLTGVCLNGGDTCRKWITPSYCFNGAHCQDGKAVEVAPASMKAYRGLQALINTRVCALGRFAQDGVFGVTAVSPEE